ncbi:MAG: penicillin-binding protein 2 [Blastocatellia bacterium]|jgi:membrane peptidoglycan carboxypeptidase|nr:penicillin-binding protein 2 [Blastocatellia bacterium]
MNSIHRLVRSLSVLFLLLSMSICQIAIGATRQPAKDRKHGRAEKRGSRSRRAEIQRLTARRRALAEAAHLAAVARERAAEEAMRNLVQSMIEKDDVTGEDPEIRRVAVNALGHHAGTVVVMDPQTGRIYSVVNQQWALREGVKPCSTIKLVTGLAGLNEKIIDPANTAAISYSNKVDLTSALAHSKNEYFQQVGGQVGFKKMISYARQLGLGEKTGINLSNESQGSVPKAKTGFAVNHMSSHGDDFKVTAVQLATLVSAMANGGKLITPFVPRTLKDERRSAPKVRRLVDINADSFERMVPGMIGAVNYGSGRRAFNPRETIAGKTGTCIEQGVWVGLFTSYAPLNNPRLAVVVIGRGADGRNHFPVTVAGRIYRDLGARFGATTMDQIANKRDPQIPKDNTAAKASAAAAENTSLASDDEESADGDDDITTKVAPAKIEPTKTIWGDARRPANSKVQRVILPLSNRTGETAKPAKASSQTETKPAQRARRVTGNQ